MAELEPRTAVDDPVDDPVDPLVIDRLAVEAFVRDAKLAVINAGLYLAALGGFVVLRVVEAVPYLRAASGLAVVVTLCAVAAKQRLLGHVAGRTWWLLGASVAGAAAALPILVALVEINRGTIFAAGAAGLAGAIVTHVVDRVALARA